MANFTLGEAIGLQGQYNIAQDISQYQRGAFAQAAKEAAERRKADEELYAELEKKLTPPKDLHKLYITPAHEITTDFTVRLRKLKEQGNISQAYGLIDQYREIIAGIQVDSKTWEDFDNDYRSSQNYTSKAQRDIKEIEGVAKNIQEFAKLAKEKGIPGYDSENFAFTDLGGGLTVNTFQRSINQEQTIKNSLGGVQEVSMPPTTRMVDGEKLLEYGTQVFWKKEQAEEWAKNNPNADYPGSVEDQVDALMQDDNFVYQFADTRGFSLTETDKIKEALMKEGLKYAKEEATFRQVSDGVNVYVNTGQTTALNQTRRSGTIVTPSTKIEHISLAAQNMTGYDIETSSLVVTPSTFDPETGTMPAAPMSNAKLTTTMVLPTRIANGGTEVPIVSAPGSMTSISPKDIHTFRFYLVFETAGGRKRYVPYGEAQSQLEISKLGNDQLTRFNTEVNQQQELQRKLAELHKANKGNANFELYQKINSYLGNRSQDKQNELNTYLESL